jgi:hypothetical protein
MLGDTTLSDLPACRRVPRRARIEEMTLMGADSPRTS